MTGDSHGLFGADAVADAYRRYLQPTLFAPWAARLIEYAGLSTGQVVLDVASGTGVVARAAASAVGPTGRVIASDISTAMLATVGIGSDDSGALIETLECSATDLAVPGDSVDVVFCQQGFPFMPDRVAVATEMLRVLRPGGTAVVAVWAAGERLHPFDAYAEFMLARDITSRFARTLDGGARNMSKDDVAAALTAGGFADVSTTLERLTVRWPTPEAEARGIAGTPFWADVSKLDDAERDRLISELAATLAGADGASVPRVTSSVFARAVKR